jgi:hypothetical protein
VLLVKALLEIQVTRVIREMRETTEEGAEEVQVCNQIVLHRHFRPHLLLEVGELVEAVRPEVQHLGSPHHLFQVVEDQTGQLVQMEIQVQQGLRVIQEILALHLLD